MAIKMHRVDFRMIHGQVAGTWIPNLGITKVVIIDDPTSKDKFVQQVLTFGAPKGCKVEFYNVEDAVARYQENKFGEETILVIFRAIETAHRCFEKGYEFKELNVGQTPRVDNMMHATASVFVTAKDVQDLVDLQAHGVNVYFRQDTTKDPVTLDSVTSKLKGKY